VAQPIALLSLRTVGSKEFDIAIIGAGPVGLATAIELAKLGLETLVIDRRPPLAEDRQLRPQILVARAGDLAHLDYLGVDITDPHLVSPLATRCEGDLASGRIVRGDVIPPRGTPSRAPDLWALAAQPPLALVPIGRLQLALLEQAQRHGATVVYDCEVTRLRRHARMVSLQCAGGTTARAAMVVIATGAARSLIATELRGLAAGDPQRLIGGVFAVGADAGRWVRVELPVPGVTKASRCTLLACDEASSAGTAVLVTTGANTETTDEQLHTCFAAAARQHGLEGAPFQVEPQVFTTGITAVSRRTIAGDGRAPVVIAGDAAQTGHVFSGQTCFVNLALALGLCNRLSGARTAIVDRKVNAPALSHALARYEGQSEIGAAILARASQRHLAAHPAGAWALAGVAART
jgi:2-polyprenyl-6-methoxyphenol hydroxylase-like FAD-dependent oxidoreductase